jgi:hypothetical protein
MKLKHLTTTIILLISSMLFGQNSPFLNKWLIILSTHNNEQSARNASEKLSFKTNIIKTNDYENLAMNYFIVALSFNNKEAASEKSKELKNKRIDNYVKFSGNSRTQAGTFEDNVKFVLNNRFIVLENLDVKYSYDNRKHELIGVGACVDVLSEITPSEIPKDHKNWKNQTYYLVDKKGDTIQSKVKIMKLHIFSRIQIESYRPPWIGHYPTGEEDENVPDSEIIRYHVWQGGQLLVGEIETTQAVIAVKDKAYLPEAYKEIPLSEIVPNLDKLLETLPEIKAIQKIYDNSVPDNEKKGIKKWYKSNDAYIITKVMTYHTDTLFYLSYGICDTPCGGNIEENGDFGWRINKGKFEEIPAFEGEFNSIFRFKTDNRSMIFKFNYNKSLLKDVEGDYEISLPYNFEDPWEC